MVVFRELMCLYILMCPHMTINLVLCCSHWYQFPNLNAFCLHVPLCPQVNICFSTELFIHMCIQSVIHCLQIFFHYVSVRKCKRRFCNQLLLILVIQLFCHSNLCIAQYGNLSFVPATHWVCMMFCIFSNNSLKWHVT